ncbi:MAG: hypothetical protein AAFQ98_27030, partial [Bacteroidota bacterium]
MAQPRTYSRRRKFNGVKAAADMQRQDGKATAPRVSYQPKLAVGKPNDAYEAEADRVADQVVKAPAANGVQRKCTACAQEDAGNPGPVQREPLAAGITPVVQRMEEEPAAHPMVQRMEEEPA